jgi:phage FluMu protein Com
MQQRKPSIALKDIFTHKMLRAEDITEETTLKMQCPQCQTWNAVPVNKHAYKTTKTQTRGSSNNVTLYEPKQTIKCRNCSTTIATPQELITAKKNPQNPT